MNEQYVQAAANGFLGLMFFILAVENLTLYIVLRRRTNPTKLGTAMKRKYAAWVVAGVALMLLQGYSAYFSITRTSGWFTVEVVAGLRAAGVVAMAVVVFSMWQMYRALRRAEDEINAGMFSELEGE